MSIDKYKNYKDSGIKELPLIPSDWDVNRLAYFGSFKKGNGISRKDITDAGLPAILYGDLYTKYDIIATKIVNRISVETSKKSVKIRNGVILFTGSGETLEDIGKSITYIGEETVFVGGDAIIYNPKNLNNEFLAYCLSAQYTTLQKIREAKGNIIFHAYASRLRNIHISFPSVLIQNKISNYLNDRTQAIDKKTYLLEQKIVKYKELRKSIINKTLTKGLDSNAQLIDSSIECIEKTPKHWILKRMKDIGFLYSGLSGKSGDDFNQDDNENNREFLPFTNIAVNTYINTYNFGTVVINDGEKQNKIKKNDLFFLMSSEGYEDIGKSSLLINEVTNTYLNSFCKGYRITNRHIDPRYLNWLLLSSTYRENLIIQGKGFTRINLKMEKINNFSIAVPPTIKEQKEIALYIDDKTTKIDSIIQNIEKQVEVLIELRKTLINDVVTGKLKVIE